MHKKTNFAGLSPVAHRNKFNGKSFIGLVLIGWMIVVTFSSCRNTDIYSRTSYLPIVNDSLGILSPRANAYFKNYSFPHGIVPFLQTVDSIPAMELGTYANDLFDNIADASPDEYAFRRYGLLIIVSRHPELIQVRVGTGYSSYLSMRGATAGLGYLQMQKGIKDKGLEDSFPLFVECACNEVSQYQNLSWFQKIRVKSGMGFVSDCLADWGTPSDTFLDQFYFRPALIVLSLLNGILHSWFLALLAIIFAVWGVRALFSSWLSNRLMDVKEHTYLVVLFIREVIAFVVSLPTLASFTMLANSRMEDYMAMKAMHIPFIELTNWSAGINNMVAPIWMIAIMAFLFYTRHIIREDGSLFLAFLPADIQRDLISQSEKFKLEATMLLKGGFMRRMIYSRIMNASDTTSPTTNDESVYEENCYEDFNKTFFYDEESLFFKANPYTAISMNDHRETLFYLTIFIIGATLICPTPMVMYFIAVWLASIAGRLTTIRKIYKQSKCPWGTLSNGAKKFLKANVRSYIYFAILISIMMLFQPLKAVEIKNSIETNTINTERISGRYFVKQAGDGLKLHGATARIDSVGEGRYTIFVYSKYTTRMSELTYDEQTYLFHSTDMGEGTLEYDKDIDKITINFSTGWIFTK